MALSSALAQEGVSRASSYISSKIEEKASRVHLVFRLQMAINRLELSLEKTRGPITLVSLLRCRKEIIKRAYDEGTCLLNKHKMQLQDDGSQQLPEDRGMGQAVTRSSLRFLEWLFCRATNWSITSLRSATKEGHLTSSTVRMYEHVAEFADQFVRDVESGCPLRQHRAFRYPSLIRWLLKGETLTYQVVQRSQLRRIHIQPVYSEGRGVEAQLCYRFVDRKVPSKHFELVLLLRISEYTDIVGTVISCLELLASQFKIVPKSAALGEISLLSSLQDISHSCAPPFHSGWLIIDDREIWRPDSICCTNNVVSSRVSSLGVPEPVSYLYYGCFVSAQECMLNGSTDEVVHNAPPLYLGIQLFPHYTSPHPGEIILFRFKGESEYKHVPDGSIQHMETMLRSKPIDNLVRQPGEVHYFVNWYSPHGYATMSLKVLSAQDMEFLQLGPLKVPRGRQLGAAKRKGPSMVPRGAKRKGLCDICSSEIFFLIQ